jgi:uncharacterized membrane protein YfcA
MGGLPVILYLIGREGPVAEARATSLAFLTVANLGGAAVLGLWLADFPSWLPTAASLLPAVVSGTLAGGWVGARLDRECFRRAVSGVAIAGGCWAVFTGLRS